MLINNTYLVPTALFSLYKQRTLEEKKRRWKNCDQELIPILNYLDTYIDLTTIHSCAGHLETAKNKKSSSIRDGYNFYIFCIIRTQRAYSKLFEFYSTTVGNLIALDNRVPAFFKIEVGYNLSIIDERYYGYLIPSFTLKALVDKEKKTMLLRSMHKTIDDLTSKNI
jgi:hypothetical protein